MLGSILLDNYTVLLSLKKANRSLKFENVEFQRDFRQLCVQRKTKKNPQETDITACYSG